MRALVADNSSFHRSRRSPSIGLSTHDGEDVEADEGRTRSDASGNESDSQFKELQNMFSLKDKGKRRAKTSHPQGAEKKGKKGEVGPSGQTYTPLEQQVCS